MTEKNIIEEAVQDAETLKLAIIDRVKDSLAEDFVPKVKELLQTEIEDDEEIVDDEEIEEIPIEDEEEIEVMEPIIPDEEEAVEEIEDEEEVEIEVPEEEEKEVEEQIEDEEEIDIDIEDDEKEEEVIEIIEDEVPEEDEDEIEEDEDEIEEDVDIDIEDNDDDEEEEVEEGIELRQLRRENRKLKSAYKKLHKELKNALVINEQYKAARKLFKKYPLTTKQKQTIVNQLSEAKTVKTIKLVSKSLDEMIGSTMNKKIKSSTASKTEKIVAKDLVKEEVIKNKDDEILGRNPLWMQRAGIEEKK